MANKKDKGKDGKQARAKQPKTRKTEEAIEEPQRDRLLDFHEILASWECPNGKDLRRNGRKITPLNCIENLFSVERFECLECGRCIHITEACAKPGGFAVENLVREYSA